MRKPYKTRVRLFLEGFAVVVGVVAGITLMLASTAVGYVKFGPIGLLVPLTISAGVIVGLVRAHILYDDH